VVLGVADLASDLRSDAGDTYVRTVPRHVGGAVAGAFQKVGPMRPGGKQLWCCCNTLKIFKRSHIAGRITWSHANWELVMTIHCLTSSSQPTAIEEIAFVTNDIRTLIANHFGVDVRRVTDEARFTDDLAADWLDCLELMILVEDQFGVEMKDDDVDQIEVVGDLIRHIESLNSDRRQKGVDAVVRKLFGPCLARAVKPAKQQEGREQAAFFLRLANDAMRSLTSRCPTTQQVVDLQIYADHATLTRIRFNWARFHCPQCGTEHETKVGAACAENTWLEPHQSNCTGSLRGGQWYA
jgi:acyl carrier protein